ncbi:DNA polymerase delta subunit 3 isoform X2 [Coffea eugenioides]|uniref:DNA polymerase delta subunit 3 isoform X2 n=1 Tax=Coffea eugenioides TaxID=49369 RepID=UPI000F613764|nr:DNA polymerase delta subunit 3 isoform X2 [Coffea eugenioides]
MFFAEGKLFSGFGSSLPLFGCEIRLPHADPNMAEIETLGILDEIQSLVSDKLQVVSYKWLSRNFLVSSNDAKRLLQDFVEKRGTGVEVVYTLSGWLKTDPSVYHIRLVSKPKLTEVKQEFDENCSVQIYSVQACLPKDPAVLWNAEFVQAEELFKQPHEVDNCLRDNRFCGVLNSFVKRNAEEANGTTSVLPVKTTGTSGSSGYTLANQSPTIPQPQQKKVQGSSPNVTLQSPNVVKDVKNESKPAENKLKVPQLAVNTKKVETDKNSSGTGGALANMWGRASAKSKAECASAKTNGISNSADAQICAREEIEHESSDDEGQGVNVKRSYNGEVGRKRRVVFDFSDEEDEFKDAVNLASPDPPKKKSMLDSKRSSYSSDIEKSKLNFEEEKEDKPNFKHRKETDRKSKEENLAFGNHNNMNSSSSEKVINHVPAVDTIVKDKTRDAAPNSRKRKKVLKTRIDERGREVTEVVWEGEEETKPESDTTKKADNIPASNNSNRPSAVKKSPAVTANAPLNQVGKTGSKKAGNKDPKQGNILSFFKRV